MDNFENKYVKEYGIHYSRIIASWYRVGGTLAGLRGWLETTPLTKEQIGEVMFLAENGKLEWENDARKYLAKKKAEGSGE